MESRNKEVFFKYISFEINVIDNGNGISELGLKQLFKNFGKLNENSQ